jgi:PAS domain S-box-containing protein
LLPIDHSLSFQDIVLDTIKEPIYAIDGAGKFVVWNQAVSELTKLTSSVVIDKPIDKLFTFQDIDIRSRLNEGKSILSFVKANGLEFRTLLEPIVKDDQLVGYRGGLYAVSEGILKALPREYLVEVINASPISAIVFNPDGSIMYSNNAYRNMWNLEGEELAFVNRNYNIFLDKQLEREGLMEYIKSAFKGKIHQSPVFKYSFKSSKLGRSDNQDVNWLIAHIFPVKDENNEVIYVVLNFMDVSDRYNLEEAYKESKERLQLALKGGDLGTWDWNLITGEVIYNERWAKMLGYELEEAYDLTWEKLLHPDDREEAIKSLKALVDGTADDYDEEFRLRTKDGHWMWILDRGKVVERLPDGSASRVAGTHIDINERKLNEEIVKENELKYRRLVENAPIGIAIVVDEKIVYVNEELVKIGRVESKEALIGMSARMFIPDEQRYAVFKEREQLVIEQGMNAPLYTTKLKTNSGEILDVEVVSIPITYEGKPAMQVLLHDITDRNLALVELSHSRELLNQLFENAPMGIVHLDKKFRVISINKGFERIFGFSNEELHGKSLQDFIVSTDLVEEANRLNNSAIKGEIDYIESYRFNKAGDKVPVLIYALPVLENDINIGIYGIYVDIKQRINAEEELKTRNLELDNFVYKVSHDLRAPLASILGLINLTKLEVNQEDQNYYIELIEGQVNKLDHFIRDILSHSKNLKMSVVADKINFKEIVQHCFDDLGYLRASTKVKRKITINQGDFYSDKWRINEIFRNLIGNAIKYRNPDVEENIVEVIVNISDTGCEIVVADNGIGIAEEKLPHVTEMFYRGTEESDGSGIGLYIVQKAIEKIEGTLKIVSKPLSGTKFEIWLPSLKKLIK